MPLLTVVCRGCGASAETDNASDPDSAVECGCCPEAHHHGENANATGTACRPVHIYARADLLAVTQG